SLYQQLQLIERAVVFGGGHESQRAIPISNRKYRDELGPGRIWISSGRSKLLLKLQLCRHYLDGIDSACHCDIQPKQARKPAGPTAARFVCNQKLSFERGGMVRAGHLASDT